MEIGAQLYTLRDFCKTPEDLAETLQKVADIGYPTVQVSGTCAYEPAWLAEQLKKTGLRCAITHTSRDRLMEMPEQVAREHDVFGCRYVGIGGMAMQFDTRRQDLEQFLEKIVPAAKVLKEHGKYFMYHNHHREFWKIDGVTMLEKLAQSTDPDIMGFTLDVFWVQAGGGDPAQWLEKLSGRVPCIHLKDYAMGEDRIMAALGEGNLNFDRIFEKAESAGTEYMLVEQDNCNGEDPFACMKRSYDYLKACGF